MNGMSYVWFLATLFIGPMLVVERIVGLYLARTERVIKITMVSSVDGDYTAFWVNRDPQETIEHDEHLDAWFVIFLLNGRLDNNARNIACSMVWR